MLSLYTYIHRLQTAGKASKQKKKKNEKKRKEIQAFFADFHSCPLFNIEKEQLELSYRKYFMWFRQQELLKLETTGGRTHDVLLLALNALKY